MSAPVLNLEQFAKLHGLTTTADVESHIHAGLRSAPQTKTFKRFYANGLLRRQEERDRTKAAYAAAIASGEILAPPEPTLVDRASGHPDNHSVQAARRLLLKRDPMGAIWANFFGS